MLEDLEDETPAQIVKRDLFNLFNELDDDPEIGIYIYLCMYIYIYTVYIYI
jgi:hypothetical protein